MFALMPRSCGCLEPSRPANTERFSKIDECDAPIADCAAAAGDVWKVSWVDGSTR
jgi:hypothetical protein